MRLAGDSAGASNPLTRSSLQSRDRRVRRVSTGKVAVSSARVLLARYLPEIFLLMIVHLDDLSSKTRALKVSPKWRFC